MPSTDRDAEMTAAPSAALGTASMEWYSAFGILSTLVWLYMEILRLIAVLRSSSNT